MGSRLRSKLTYANITASLALFVALGGTGYAATQLPRNSVGTKQIRTNGVGASELRSSAVTSRDIRDRTIGARDMSSGARRALAGPAGPVGPSGPAGSATDYRAAINGVDLLNRSDTRVNGNEYRVYFEAKAGGVKDVASCAFNATLAAVPANPSEPPFEPEAGRITVGFVKDDKGPAALVRTYGADGSPKPQPFHITASC